MHEVSINTRVSDMRILHIDTPARLLEREHSRNVNFSGKLQYKRKQQLILIMAQLSRQKFDIFIMN